jgi:DNA polymerase elongation subunit (family B)
VADITRKHNFLIADKTVVENGMDDDKYEGAIVLQPKIGLYLDTPVSVLD